MALVSENLKTCGVRIDVSVGGVPSVGSGVVYVTPNFCDYNYVLTAKHIFQEDSQTSIDISQILSIQVFYSSNGELHRLEYVKKNEIKNKLITFKQDFAIILISKSEEVAFSSILVTDQLEDDDHNFFSWATFSANLDEMHKFDFVRDDPEINRFKSTDKLDHNYLSGMSGAGVFTKDKSILCGIISKYPNENFQNGTIDCTQITFSEINKVLASKSKVELDTRTSRHKREIKNRIIDIHQVYINEVCLDLELARKRLEVDIKDDWYYDPLNYIDLLNQDYLFEQFESFFNTNNYKALEAEKFYVPKKKFTHRPALVSPFIDRIVYLAVVGVIAEKLDKAMIPNVYSARYNKFSNKQLIINGVEQWKKMEYKLFECANLKNEEEYVHGCVIEIDLLNFYDNINKNLLNEKILRVCETPNEKKAAKLLHNIINNFSRKELGLPQNSDASSLLASFYLNQVDVFMQHIAPYYYRFMDDVRIFCSDKYEARKILQTFEFEIRRCHLSVNSQKTRIFDLVDKDSSSLKENEKSRKEYNRSFNIELNKLARLRISGNYAYLNEAFHLSIKLLENLQEEDINSSEDSARELNYALNTLVVLGRKGIGLSVERSFINLIEIAVKKLKDRPWITTQVCRVLSLISSQVIKEDFLKLLKEIVLSEKYNTYSFQTYQIWLLLARHKCNSSDLKKYAIKQIEKNDETNRPVIASMVIYMCAVDSNYRRVALRKFGENFTRGYFQNRIAIISLRSFDIDNINDKYVDETLKKSLRFTNKYGKKDLIYVQGSEEDSEEIYFEQLYSI